MKKIFVFSIILLTVILGQVNVKAAILEVGSGYPYTLIGDAINDSLTGDEVLVYDGIYLENIDFAGKEITLRSVNGQNVTIIDGGNSGSVINFSSGEGFNTVLNGFTIQNGSASYGAGIRCWNSASPTIENCIIKDNIATDSGGGIYCFDLCSPNILNCTIKDNIAGNNGGGIYYENTIASLSKCVLSGNSASSGAAIYIDHSTLKIVNCTVSGNYASYAGGGISCHYAILGLTNCTIFANKADYYGGGISCYQSAVTGLNNILWNNIAWEISNEIYVGASSSFYINYSDFNPLYIAGTWAGNYNINQPPLVVSPINAYAAPTSSGDFHLTKNSLCIDAGTGLSRTVPLEDIDGDSRPQSGIWFAIAEYDIGSDEYKPVLIPMLNGSILGFVTDLKGDPLESVSVKLKLAKKEVAKTVTDEKGRYKFKKLANGIYKVIATKPRLGKRVKQARVQGNLRWAKKEYINFVFFKKNIKKVFQNKK